MAGRVRFLVGLLLAGLGVYLLWPRATLEVVTSPSAPVEEERATAPDLLGASAAPATTLAAAPARAAGSAPDRAKGPGPASDTPALAPPGGGALTVRLERPPDRPELLAAGALTLVLSERFGAAPIVTVGLPPAPAEGGLSTSVPGPTADGWGEGAGGLVAWRLAIPAGATSPVPVVRWEGLAAGEWLVKASLDGSAKEYRPALARVGERPSEVTLVLTDPAGMGFARLAARREGAAVLGRWTATWRDFYWGSWPAVDEVVLAHLPPDEDVTLAFEPAGAPLSASPPSQVLRVPSGVTADALFEVPPVRSVLLRVLRPGGEPVPRASVSLWRAEGPSWRPVQKVLDAKTGEGAGHLGTYLSPGRYGSLVTEVAPYASVFFPFEVGGLDVTHDLVLEALASEVSCRLERDDGTPATGYALWLGRLDGPDPSACATTMATSDEEGILRLGTLADGPYLVADYGYSRWLEVEVRGGRMEPEVVRLPSREPPKASAVLRGTVRGPGGERVAKGLVSFGPAQGWAPYAHFTEGRFALSVPAGEGVLRVHHTWFEASRFAAHAQPLRVEAGTSPHVEVRLAPR